jgi:hypothetical protein
LEEIDGDKLNMPPKHSQTQVKASRQDLALKMLNVQQTLNTVLETLERIEALEGHQRNIALPRNQEGDRNHTDLDTNILALDIKLKCFSVILDQYKDQHFNEECLRNLDIWYNRSSKSKLIKSLWVEAHNAVLGNHEFKTPPEPVDQRDMAEAVSGLAKGTRIYQDKITKVEENPELYIKSDQIYKIKDPNPNSSEEYSTISRAQESDIQPHSVVQNHAETGSPSADESEEEKQGTEAQGQYLERS